MMERWLAGESPWEEAMIRRFERLARVHPAAPSDRPRWHANLVRMDPAQLI